MISCGLTNDRGLGSFQDLVGLQGQVRGPGGRRQPCCWGASGPAWWPPRACPTPALRPLGATVCAQRTVLGPQPTKYGKLGGYFSNAAVLHYQRDACFAYKAQTGQEPSEVHSSRPPGSQQPHCASGFKSSDSGPPPTDAGRPPGPPLFHVALRGAQATRTLGALPGLQGGPVLLGDLTAPVSPRSGSGLPTSAHQPPCPLHSEACSWVPGHSSPLQGSWHAAISCPSLVSLEILQNPPNRDAAFAYGVLMSNPLPHPLPPSPKPVPSPSSPLSAFLLRLPLSPLISSKGPVGLQEPLSLSAASLPCPLSSHRQQTPCHHLLCPSPELPPTCRP